MIISDKWKYIFVGLPFSASSAISKELLEYYDGQPVAWKHANITEQIAKGRDISKYYVFAVYRNPVEITFSHYNKLLTNAYGVFTKPECFRENGGWVTKRARSIFHEVRSKSLDFNSYIRLHYKFPYDSVFSLNKPYLNKVLDFGNINDSFQEALLDIGIKAKRELPLFNKTDKPGQMNLEEGTARKVFAPFLYYNDISGIDKPTIYDALLYHIIQPVRFLKWKKADEVMSSKAVKDHVYL